MINFPNSPIQGQIFTSTTGLKYVYLDGVWCIVEAPQDIGKAQARNRIVNGAMQISQEWSDTFSGQGSTLASGTFFAADQFGCDWSVPGTVGVGRVQSVTPNGSVNRIRFTVGTASASLTTTHIVYMVHVIEGVRTADFRWGTASARQVILRFGFKGPAGTYSIALHPNGYVRSYVTNFTVSAGQANTDTVQTFIIPGDTAGTWNTNNTHGISVTVCFAAGPTRIGAAGWSSGAYYATASNTNNIATAGNVFEIFDFGFYLDPLNTGIAPPWVMPDEAEELRACQRYWRRCLTVVPTGSVAQSWTWSVQFRTTPAVTGGGSGFYSGNMTMDMGCFQQTTLALQTLYLNARM